MARLEDLTAGARVRGLIPEHATTVVQVQWHGSDVLTLTYRDEASRVAEQLLYRDDEARLEVGLRERTVSIAVTPPLPRDGHRAGQHRTRPLSTRLGVVALRAPRHGRPPPRRHPGHVRHEPSRQTRRHRLRSPGARIGERPTLERRRRATPGRRRHGHARRGCCMAPAA